ncbi:MAG: porin [Pseudomonadota bacterium]
MKKVLLASTALILTAGVAAADGHAGVALSGSANAGLKYDANATDEISVHNEVNMVITGSGATDSGLEFGAFIDIDEDSVDDAEVFISGLFGTITVGGIDPATDGFGIADVGFDGIGADDAAEQFKNATAGADILYSYSASGLTFTASAEIGANESYGVALEYAAGAFSAGIGYIEDTDGAAFDTDDDGTDDLTVGSNSTVTVAAGFSQGAFSANAIYSDWSVGGEGYGVDASFTTGAVTITAVYSDASGVSAGGPIGDSYGLGFKMPLGGGLSVAGGIGSIREDQTVGSTGATASRTVADLGLTMSF